MMRHPNLSHSLLSFTSAYFPHRTFRAIFFSHSKPRPLLPLFIVNSSPYELILRVIRHGAQVCLFCYLLMVFYKLVFLSFLAELFISHFIRLVNFQRVFRIVSSFCSAYNVFRLIYAFPLACTVVSIVLYGGMAIRTNRNKIHSV